MWGVARGDASVFTSELGCLLAPSYRARVRGPSLLLRRARVLSHSLVFAMRRRDRPPPRTCDRRSLTSSGDVYCRDDLGPNPDVNDQLER